MATGRLGAVALVTDNTNNLVYTSPTGFYSVFNVSICNTTTTAVTIRMAISTSSTAGGVAASEYIEYDTIQVIMRFIRAIQPVMVTQSSW